jgi:hypothetical protein
MAIDPAQILNAEVGVMDTKFIPIDDGEYVAMIPQGGVAEPRAIKVDGEDRYVVDVNWEISSDDPRFAEQAKKTGMKVPRVRQSLFLDINSKGTLANGPGQNVQLGRLRAAVGQNDPTKKWAFKHLEGVAARIKVEHRLHEGDTFAQVAKKDGVTKL